MIMNKADVQCLNPYCIGCTSLSDNCMAQDILEKGLNPYCIGCTSLRLTGITIKINCQCLNPYCIGCTSLRPYKPVKRSL